MNSDLDIIEECLNGNQLAFKKLYERYLSYCFGMCRRYAVHQSDLKDVVQIIFTQTFQSLKNFDRERAQFKTWFTHVCINHIFFYKKKQRKRFQTEDINESTSLFSGSKIEEDIDKAYILSLIQRMPNNYQLVFNLFIIDGFSHEEIAQKLDISTASSRVLLNRARGWIKKNFVNHLNA